MRFIILSAFILSYFLTHAQKNGEFGKGYHRVTYMNVHDCKTELQSLDSTITVKKLENLRSYLYHFGAKGRGIEVEFPAFRVYDFTGRSKTREALILYSKKQISNFDKGIAKLKKAHVEKEFQPMKDELLNNYNKRLRFEKIINEWYISQDDKVLCNKVLEFYSDKYMIATLEKTLALKGMDKLIYTYVEIYDIVNARLFDYDRINYLQNKIMSDYKIDVVVDTCNKS